MCSKRSSASATASSSSRGEVVADAAPRDLTELMSLPTLESVFAQLVQQTDTEQVARDLVDVMKVRHG
jgi:ABC-2 type transport system ATP-binding protein